MNERFPTSPEELPHDQTPETERVSSGGERGPEIGPEELKEVVDTAEDARVFIRAHEGVYNEFHIIADGEAIAVRNAEELTDSMFDEIKKESRSVLVRIPIEQG